ncbi:MAG: hypothetical protein KAI69_05505 [Deltaproteobacteria bacterium]|nr:hypothetical protein [Deltaproteobacteria bacterium]
MNEVVPKKGDSLLVLTTPLMSRLRRFKWALAGCLGLNIFYALLVIIILALGLAPHPWLIKSIIVGLPFTVYFLFVARIDDGSPVLGQIECEPNRESADQ